MRRSAALFTAAVLAAGSIIGLTGTASAEDGWYASAGTGVTYVPNLNIPNSVVTANSTKISSSLGMAIVGAGGYAFGPIRVEGEFGWRDNGLDKMTTPALGTVTGNGDLVPLSFMANVYYDFDTATKFTPYIGAGLGAVDLTGQIEGGGSTITNMGRFGLGYQGIAGVAYKVNDALSLKADYRYLATTETNLPDDTNSIGAGTAKMTYESHAILVGFIYHFGAPPPAMAATAAVAAAAPPPPAPAPAPEPGPPPVAVPHQFLVFFDFDKTNISHDARQIIEQAATIAKSHGVARIALTGHTDLAGPAGYNMKLSVKRAEAVKKVLVQLGIPADEISVVGKGKTEPLVPTADGVREPKNRRVEIELPQ